MEILNFDLLNYIYVEYTLSVIIVTELVRWIFRGIDISFRHPKNVVLVVAILLAVVGYFLKSYTLHDHLSFFKIITSFGVSILGYDYFWKPIKDFIKRRNDDKRLGL